jgi:STE24 endopeptidase
MLYFKKSPPSALVRACKSADKTSASELAAIKGISREDLAKPVLEWMDLGDSTVLQGAVERMKDKEGDGDRKTTPASKSGPNETQLAEAFPKSQAYGLDKSRFGFVRSAVGLTATLFLLVTGMLPRYWALASSATEMLLQAAPWLGSTTGIAGDVCRAALFVGVSSGVDTVIGWPLDLYFNFVIQQRHGFNRQTLGLWVTDQIKGIALSVIIGTPVIGVIVLVLQASGEWLPLYLWGTMVAVQIVAMLVYPTLIQPLFNTFEQLPPGPVRTVIESLASSLGFPRDNIVVVDGTLRSSHSNAYVIGFGPAKRITIYDSLLSQMTIHEAEAVMAHELGHWKHGHIYALLLVNALQVGAIFGLYAFAAEFEPLYESLGFGPGDAEPIVRLVVFMELGMTPVQPVIQFLASQLSRSLEYDADRFAVDRGHSSALQRGLVKLSLENLSTPWVDSLYSAYYYSHPALPERLAAIAEREASIAKKST